MKQILSTMGKLTSALVFAVFSSGMLAHPAFAATQSAVAAQPETTCNGNYNGPESGNIGNTGYSYSWESCNTISLNRVADRQALRTVSTNTETTEASSTLVENDDPITEVYLTAYTMPDNWDGNGFNTTAVPQTIYGQSDRAELCNRDCDGQQQLQVTLPTCENIQIDLYFAPEIKQVGTAGHGAQYISHKFAPRQNCAVTPCPATSGPVVITPQNMQGFTTTESRATGKWEFLEDGLRIYTTGTTSTDKVAWYKPVDFSLQNGGTPELEYVASPDPAIPGKQLVMDFDNNGTSDGILVGEPVYGNDWWLTNSSAQFAKDGAPSHTGGSGSANHGTLDQWLTSFPNAQVKGIGFSLGSGVKGDGIIKSMTFGCVKYVFTNKKADIVANDLKCTTRGAEVTLTNNGRLDGTANVNGTDYPVAAGTSVTVGIPLDANFTARALVTFNGKTIYDQTVTCAPGNGGGGETPETPQTPTTPSTPQTLGTSTELPATIPATGSETLEAQNPFMIVLAAIAAYGAAYFLQGRVLARKQS